MLFPYVDLTSPISIAYTLEGRAEPVRALFNIHLYPGSEYYPIRRYEYLFSLLCPCLC